MNRYVIDFETTFSKENTLTTKSIEAYVRDPKFEVIGCGIWKRGRGPAHWVSGDGIKEYKESFEEPGTSVACHHAQFDLFILNHVYGIKPAYIYDTLSMSRALYPRLPKHSLEAMVAHLHLGAPKSVPYNLFRGLTLAETRAGGKYPTEGQIAWDRVGPGESQPLTGGSTHKGFITSLEKQIADGCLHDVELTANLFNTMIESYPQSELDLIDATVRLFTEPKLAGDLDILEDCLTDAIYERDHWPEKLGVCKDVLLSDRKFASLLAGTGIELPTKLSPTSGKPIHAFAKSDKSFTDLREHEDKNVRDIVEARLAVKTSIAETRAARLLDTALRGSIPVYLRYYGAHTGRFSGGDKVNLQNLPRNSKLRGGLKAPTGHTLIWADFSQIECRILACLSGCEALRSAFAGGRDVYSEFGTRLFSVPVSKSERTELRYLSKKVVLGAGYGIGPDKFMRSVNADAANDPKLAGFSIDMQMAQKAVWGYRKEYPEIPALWKNLDVTLELLQYGHIHSKLGSYPIDIDGQKLTLPNGLFLDYTGLQHDGESYRCGAQKLWGGALTENIVQALARIVMTDAWLALKNCGLDLVLSVHDELVFCVRENQLSDARVYMQEIMTTAPDWMPNLPLAVEISHGDHYSKG